MSSLLKQVLLRIRGEVSTETLVKRGMKIGIGFQRMNGVWLDPGHCWLIQIGDNVTLAPRVTVLAHDAALQHALHTTKVGLVTIGSEVFIGAGSILCPGVTIGDHCIIGAGSVVRQNIPANSVAVGNPAIVVMQYEEYVASNARLMQTAPCFGSEYLMNHIDEAGKREMIASLDGKKGFLV